MQSGVFKDTEKRLPYVLLIPALLVIVGTIVYPILYSLTLSFRDVTLIRPHYAPFIGLRNYREIFTSVEFWKPFGRSLYFTFVSVGLEIILGVGIALVLNEDFPLATPLRLVMLIPWAIPPVVNALMWKWIYNPSYGALNGLLWQLGLIDNYRQWLAEPFRALNLVIIADVWKMTPFVALLMLAGLQAIPEQLFEAARVDGASGLKTFTNVTLPHLKPFILVALVLRTLQAIPAFDIIYVITGGGPASGTQTIAYYLYELSFGRLNMGLGSALSFTVTLFIAFFAVVYIKFLETDD